MYRIKIITLSPLNVLGVEKCNWIILRKLNTYFGPHPTQVGQETKSLWPMDGRHVLLFLSEKQLAL